MKVYTGGGDKGQTSLFSGERVAKHHDRIEAYGDLDELNSVIGGIVTRCPEDMPAISAYLVSLQSHLFMAGAWLATTSDSPAVAHLKPFTQEVGKEVESNIDALSDALPPLRDFILPGGSPVATWAHLGRTVCRRCERRVTALDGDTTIDSDALAAIQVFLNRLSDYLFVLARYCNHHLQIDETVWQM